MNFKTVEEVKIARIEPEWWERHLAEAIDKLCGGANQAEISISYYDNRTRDTLDRYADDAIAKVGDGGSMRDAFTQEDLGRMFGGPSADKLVAKARELGFKTEYCAYYHPYGLVDCDVIVSMPDGSE